jgi:hypothetical protein
MPAVLGRMIAPTLRRLDFCIIRIAGVSGTMHGKPIVKQLTVNEPGHFKYERDRSRDPSEKNPQKLGDTPSRFLFRKLGHAFELYPLLFLLGFWVSYYLSNIIKSFQAVIFVYIVYISFEKIEVWLDRSQKIPVSRVCQIYKISFVAMGLEPSP